MTTRYVCPFCGEDYGNPRAMCCGEVGCLEQVDDEPTTPTPTRARLVIRTFFRDGTPTPSGYSCAANGGGYRSARHCAVELARRHRQCAMWERRIGLVTPRVVERLPNGIRLTERSRIQIITFEENQE